MNLSSNNLCLKKTSSKNENSKIRDLLSNFMLSNKTMIHLLIKNCEIDKNTAEFFLGCLMIRTNCLFLHTENNMQMFDGIAMFNMK